MAIFASEIFWVKTRNYDDDDKPCELSESHWQLVSKEDNRVLYRYSCRPYYEIPASDILIEKADLIDPDGKSYGRSRSVKREELLSDSKDSSS